MRLLVTGANGFVGRALCDELIRRGNKVVAGTRSGAGAPTNCEPVAVGNIDGVTDWQPALEGSEVVVHLAAHVHIPKSGAIDGAMFRTVNAAGTLHLAKQAASRGVKRFVYLSSVKVHGEVSRPGFPIQEDDLPHPVDGYGLSKWEAEKALQQLAKETGMDVVIIRPPLVYGPQVKANFATLMRAVLRGWPLPLGAIHNQRSLVALDNLTDFIATCIFHPAAAHQTFLVSDGHDISTTDLVRGLAQAAGLEARLIPVSPGVLEFVGACLGKRDQIQRLCGNLQVDISKARRELGWTPPISISEGLRRAIADRVMK